MTGPATGLRRVASAAQRLGVAVAIAAVAALVGVGPPGSPARAATNTYDQITGVGTTDSAITVPWTSGLLDSTNQPIVSANADRSAANPTSLDSFMYPDFKNLSVTVSQTQDLTHQGITVTWNHGADCSTSNTCEQTIVKAGVSGNFLQMLECYGDSSSGPQPEDCEYGSSGLFSGTSQSTGSRTGDLCVPNSRPSTTSPPMSVDESFVYGCDPAEPGSSNPPHVAPCNNCNGVGAAPQNYSIPFIPVGGGPTDAVYGATGTTTYFNEFDTNEVQQAVTGVDGTGQTQFETLTVTQAPGLGCGAQESDGSTRDCWLVIVPRGQYEPNGYKITGNTGPGSAVLSSPLSASNWAMRIQVHLAYAPVQAFCPIGTKERATVGTQLVTRAVGSWELALNHQANCQKVYGFSAVPEATSTQQLSDPASSGTGLAFTTIPIGSEANIGTSKADQPTVTGLLYAPVAVTAVDFGFNINESTGYIATPIKLTPQLVAQAITQAYRFDIPDYYPQLTGYPGPDWSQANPTNISQDPQFKALNPEVVPNSSGQPLAPLLTEDHSQTNQQIWQWLQADASTASWLDGSTSGDDTVTADPDYTALDLGKAPAIDSFPRAYTACLDLGTFTTSNGSGGTVTKEEKRCTLDLLPYTDNYDSASSNVVIALNPATSTWSALALGPDNTQGWWGTAGPEPPGLRFVWGASDMADLAAYGDAAAQFCDDAGNNCIGPSAASVTAALNSATTDSTGLLQVDPAKPGDGAWPLVQVVYAAVSTNQDPQALSDYADLIAYAAGTGQTAGVAPGDLPPGYLPMPDSLKSQAQAVVDKLRGIAGRASSSPTSAPTQPLAPQKPASDAFGAAPGFSASTPAAGTQGASATPTPSVPPTPPYELASPPTAFLSASSTPRQPVGAIRWVLLAVVLAGAGAAAGGTVLRTARVPRWLHRLRP